MTRSDIRDILFAHLQNTQGTVLSNTIVAPGFFGNNRPLIDWLAQAAQELVNHPAQRHMYDAIALLHANAPCEFTKHSLWCAYAHVKIVI